MTRFKRVAVYCGSSSAVSPAYLQAARDMGQLLADRGLGLVYGGGRVGLMGACADAATEAGGEVLGVIPRRLQDLEVGHHGITQLFVVDGMQPRKSLMIHLADAYVALPGGYGTWEELLEVLTLGILNYHRKPVGVLNVNGYYDKFFEFIRHGEREGFIRPRHHDLLVVEETPEALLAALEQAEMPSIEDVLTQR